MEISARGEEKAKDRKMESRWREVRGKRELKEGESTN